MGFNRSSAVSELLGLEGFVVTGRLWELGQWTLWVDHEPPGPTGCPACGTRAWRHDRRRHVVRDLPISGVAVRLIGNKVL